MFAPAVVETEATEMLKEFPIDTIFAAPATLAAPADEVT